MRPWQWAFLAVNALAFFLMGLDKFKAARGRWRIPERTLFLFPLLGGAVGGSVGMMVFCHKTRKWYFRWLFPALALAQLLGLCWLMTRPAC